MAEASFKSHEQALEADLRRRLRGEVSFSPGMRAMYAQDSSPYRVPPVGIVFPRDAADAAEAVAVARAFDAAILPRGAGTSLAGQGCNAAVVLDFSRHMTRILEIDPERRTARVEPGVILDDLRDAAAPFGLTFGPDPSTHAACTLGGMIGNNACGVHSVMAGKTVDNVEAMELLLYDGTRLALGPTVTPALERLAEAEGRTGEIHAGLKALRESCGDAVRRDFPDIPRRVSGYNLDELLPERGMNTARALVGSEGTCGVMLEATVRLVESRPERTLVVIGYPDIAAAGDDVPALAEFAPIGLEGMADSLVENMRAKGLEAAGVKLLPEGRAWLFVEFGADRREAASKQAQALRTALEARSHPPPFRVIQDPATAAHIWKAREAGVGASARLADGTDTAAGWEDAAVHPARLGDYLRDFAALLDSFGYRSTQYGHFGEGLVHCRIDFDLASGGGIARYRAFLEAAADLVVRHGGSLSGEHGDGRARAELWPRMFSPEVMAAFKRFKQLWDPQGRMNPGRLIDPAPLDTELRFGPGYRRPEHETVFAYPEDDGSVSRAIARCIGVGKCRRGGGGTMCPSYKATGEERHSTRGRARLLFAMAEGELPGGWRNEEVKEALDLCLACKGCKGDCPAGVDIATYKAEFLSKYYEGRRRPLSAQLFGRIPDWAPLAAKAAPLANLLTGTPGLAGLVKRIAGIAPPRPLPKLARPTLRQRVLSQSGAQTGGRGKVLLWVDTFTEHFDPAPGLAAWRLLDKAGFEVALPRRRLCCGRTYYDAGLLEQARARLEEVLETLSGSGDDGPPVIVLEPSCAAVFREEMGNLFPDDPRAQALRERVHTLAEFLNASGAADSLSPRSGRVVFHAHCHQKAVLGTASDHEILEAVGFEVSAPDTGCCGMAGGFGYEASSYEVSLAVAENAFLPALRAAGEEAPIVSDGYSCREQLRQLTGRRARHLAELLGDRD